MPYYCNMCYSFDCFHTVAGMAAQQQMPDQYSSMINQYPFQYGDSKSELYDLLGSDLMATDWTCDGKS